MSKVKDTVLATSALDLKEVPTTTSSNRKIRAKRRDIHFPVNVSYRGNPIHGYAEAINISWSGMLLATNFPVSQGDEFTLEFTLPSFHLPIQVQAKVIRVIPEKYHDEATLVGFSFINLETNISRMISGFVLEHLEI